MFDCYVAIDEEIVKEHDIGVLRVSAFVGTHLGDCILKLTDKESSANFMSGDIITKFITARQGKIHFKAKED